MNWCTKYLAQQKRNFKLFKTRGTLIFVFIFFITLKAARIKPEVNYMREEKIQEKEEKCLTQITNYPFYLKEEQMILKN